MMGGGGRAVWRVGGVVEQAKDRGVRKGRKGKGEGEAGEENLR